ncbi:hypothetical protein IEQ34_024674 [Dendrobium chrysotoxum]|uniref:H(+)-transporting two-sector ATPase n=1 Tax=Dendrobium chrysotoxum TaxID=161865 RepID=A0AAV7FRK8_DENCH|nr:hypothetical protein IEQ34_024674 [Dendrobium chrysotoxum]
MPQLDKLTYFTQFFWLCLLFFTFSILICNDGDGILGISRILKLRNQLLSHRGNKIRSNDPNSLEDISRKGFSTGVSYMYSSFFEVSQWCQTVDLLGKRLRITLISCFGEISGSRGIERNILYLISKSSYNTSSSRITCRNEIMLIHVPHGQGSIFFRGERNIPIMSMSIESMLLAVNSNFLVFSVSLDDMMGQSFASLVPTVAAAESAIGSAIFVLTFRVRGTIAVESINCIQDAG